MGTEWDVSFTDKKTDLEVDAIDQYVMPVEDGYVNIQYIGYSFKRTYCKDLWGTVDTSREPRIEHYYLLSYTFVEKEEMEEEKIKKTEEDNKYREEQKKARDKDLQCLTYD